MHLMLVLFVAVMWSNQVTHSDSFKHLISQSSAPPPKEYQHLKNNGLLI